MTFNLYPQGSLPLDRMVTRRYRLEALDRVSADMHSGVSAKGVLLLG